MDFNPMNNNAGYSPQMNNNNNMKQPKNDIEIFSILALIFGIISILTNCTIIVSFLFGLAAITMAAFSRYRLNKFNGMAAAALVCAGVGIIMAILMILLSTFMISSIEDAIDDLRRSLW